MSSYADYSEVDVLDLQTTAVALGLDPSGSKERIIERILLFEMRQDAKEEMEQESLLREQYLERMRRSIPNECKLHVVPEDGHCFFHSLIAQSENVPFFGYGPGYPDGRETRPRGKEQ